MKSCYSEWTINLKLYFSVLSSVFSHYKSAVQAELYASCQSANRHCYWAACVSIKTSDLLSSLLVALDRSYGEEMSYKTRSDSLMLRRQIRHLKDYGSELGDDLETDSKSFLGGVQIVRTRNRNIPEVVSWCR